jgi:diguanylate cyclase (GGDEF)-like protein
VARLLREQVRSDDLVARELAGVRGAQELHARFGGDEFCFLIPDLDEFSAAWVIAERFREAVHRHDWISEDERLDGRPVNVDVGVVCLLLGPVAERRPFARTLAHELLARADKLMYEAKAHGTGQVSPLRVRVVDGALREINPNEHPE